MSIIENSKFKSKFIFSHERIKAGWKYINIIKIINITLPNPTHIYNIQTVVMKK